MKRIIYGLFVVLVLYFAQSCKNNNPGTPGQDTPTATMTSCVACTSTDTPTITSTSTATPTITVTTVSSHYNFEGGTLDGWAMGGWGGPTNCGAISAGVVSAPTPYSAGSPHALKLDYSLTALCDQALISLVPSMTVNMTGKAIVAHIWVPASLISTSVQYGVNVGITGSLGEQTGTPHAFVTGVTWTADTMPGWNSYSWSLSGAGEDAVTEIAIMIGKAGSAPDTSGSLYIDEIVWF